MQSPPFAPRQLAERLERVLDARWVRRFIVWAGSLALPWIVLFRFAPYTSTTIGNDYTLYPLDAQLELVWSWKAGMVPLYVPGYAGGAPAAALTLGQAWHPITWLCAVLPWFGCGGAEITLTTVRFLELGVAHALVYRASRTTGLRPPSALFISLVTVFNARMLDSFRYGASLEGYVALLALLAVFTRAFATTGWTRARIATGALVTFLLAVSGHPQWAFLGGITAVLFVALLPWCARHWALPTDGASSRVRFLGGAALAMLAGTILSLGYLLPFVFDFLRDNGGRVDRGYWFTTGWSDSPRGTLSNFFRPLESDVHGAFGGSVAPLLLLVAAPIAIALRKKRPWVLVPIVALVVIALLFAVGPITYVHPVLVHTLPLFMSFRAPGRINLAIVPMLLATGWIVLGDVDDPGRRRVWANVPPVALAAIGALAAMAVFEAALPVARFYGMVPLACTRVPVFVGPVVFASFGIALTAFTLVGVRRRGLGTTTWIAIVALTGLAAALSLSFGTWDARRTPSRTLATIDAYQRGHLTFLGNPGEGMETKLLAHAEDDGVPRHALLSNVDEHFRLYASDQQVVLALKQGIPLGLVALSGAPLDVSPSEPPAAAIPPEPRPRARLTAVNWNRWTFRVDAPRGGIFVFGQPALPGWRATVDGSPAPIRTANALFTAVPLPLGTHEVVLHYVSPATVVPESAIFFGTAFAIVAFAVLRRGRPDWRRRWLIVVVAGALLGTSGYLWFRALDPPLNLLVAPPMQ